MSIDMTALPKTLRTPTLVVSSKAFVSAFLMPGKIMSTSLSVSSELLMSASLSRLAFLSTYESRHFSKQPGSGSATSKLWPTSPRSGLEK